ncbi:MAG: hypothetical protein N4A47_00845 [Clostridia bacterium]|jgi:hypothetical protein|nr:hypothetical protein [Clostridia bacterium]
MQEINQDLKKKELIDLIKNIGDGENEVLISVLESMDLSVSERKIIEMNIKNNTYKSTTIFLDWDGEDVISNKGTSYITILEKGDIKEAELSLEFFSVGEDTQNVLIDCGTTRDNTAGFGMLAYSTLGYNCLYEEIQDNTTLSDYVGGLGIPMESESVSIIEKPEDIANVVSSILKTIDEKDTESGLKH